MALDIVVGDIESVVPDGWGQPILQHLGCTASLSPRVLWTSCEYFSRVLTLFWDVASDYDQLRRVGDGSYSLLVLGEAARVRIDDRYAVTLTSAHDVVVALNALSMRMGWKSGPYSREEIGRMERSEELLQPFVQELATAARMVLDNSCVVARI